MLLAENEVASIQSDQSGAFKLWLARGTYTLKITASGYQNYQNEINIESGNIKNSEIELVKQTVVASKPRTSSPANVSDGNYQKMVVNTHLGSFTVYILTFDLANYEMIVDTAADGDCEDNCPVKSLSQYVSENGGVAGIHGTYFCPSAYSSCVGKTNSFYFKIHNGRTGNRINWSNGLGDYLPFLMITNSGEARYFDTWSQAKNMEMKTGISCKPHLVENGQIVLTAADMDSDKESVYKSTHGFIGLKGQTIYAGIVTGANLYDSAAVSLALGLDNSFNLDGGGTSALYYNGSYKIGPGRSMPNAIIFKRR